MKTSTALLQSGENARERWVRCKALFDEHAKSIQDFHAQLETSLNDSSPGSLAVPDYLSSPSDSQAT